MTHQRRLLTTLPLRMTVKIFKGVWLMSLLGTMAILMYVYASLPDQVVMGVSDSPPTMSRNGIFYSVVLLLTVFNVLIAFGFSRSFRGRNDNLMTWFYGLIVLLNFFLVVCMQFVNVMNSAEKFDYSRIGYLIYGSVGLLALWAAALPALLWLPMFRSKPTVVGE